jgi:putative nucleotidyltransferase with HDIG domain
MSIEMQAMVKDAGTLISFPEVFLRVNDMVNDPTSTSGDIANLISQDPGLTVRLLKVANSPFYGSSRQIETVARAVTLLGTAQIRDLVLASSTGQMFAKVTNEVIFIDDFWHHSIFCGLAAKSLAAASGKVTSDFAFVAGLLHDVGQLVLFHEQPGQMRVALDMVADPRNEMEMYQAEQAVFGFDHMQLGGALLRAWHLPERLQECVEFHHKPALAKHYPVEVALVHIANGLASYAAVRKVNDQAVPAIEESSWAVVGLAPDIIESTIEAIEAGVTEVKNLLSLNG